MTLSKITPIRILTVGDGDLTLSLALVRAYRERIQLTASTLLDAKSLAATYSNTQKVLSELEEWGATIVFQLDATQLHRNSRVDNNYDLIIFHHPHLGALQNSPSETEHALRHYRLLCHYFHAASQCICDDGQVHVCLCGTQAQTWRMNEAAENQSLVNAGELTTQSPFQRVWDRQETEDLAYPPASGMAAPRRYRNGKHGSKHWLGKYGYQHRRTHGNAYDKEANVVGSMHYLFSKKSRWKPHTKDEHALSVVCSICQWKANSKEILIEHLHGPALPDPVVDNHQIVEDDERSVDSQDNFYLSSNAASVVNHGSLCLDVKNYSSSRQTEVFETVGSQIVDDTHDGRRLRWFLQHQYFSGKSKNACQRVCSQGQVLVNGEVVTDSGRILHRGWKVNVIGEVARSPEEVKVLAMWDPLVVVQKPVGMRTVGSFEGTLEYIFSRQSGKGYRSLSKLETGIGGLCLLGPPGTKISSPTSTLTALVHGIVNPTIWVDRNVKIPLDNLRRWGSVSANGTSCPATISVVGKSSKKACCSVSTLQIQVDGSIPAVASAVSFFLRHQGHPVVGDRFANQEYLSLPRSVRNRIKGKLCMGVTGLSTWDKTCEQIVPDKWRASYWDDFLQRATNRKEFNDS